jgi:hypothetical protein
MAIDLTGAIYYAHYDPKAANRYIIRSVISAALWAVITIFVFLVIDITNWWLFALIFIALISPLLVSISTALKAKKKYGTDNGLAIAVMPEGILLPGRRLIQWHNIVGVREGGTGIVTGDVWVYAFTTWLGIRETRLIDIYVNGGVDEIDRMHEMNPQLAQELGAGGTRAEPWKGFRVKAAYIQGLGDGLFNESLRASITAAQSQGIPTDWK